MSCANPANRLGDNGAKFRTPCVVGGLFDALLAARSSDNNLPLIANSIIKRCGSEIQNIIFK